MTEISGWNREWNNNTRKPHKKLYFNITADDILNGKPRSNGGWCPVEIAVKRDLGLGLTMGLTVCNVDNYWDEKRKDYFLYRGSVDDSTLSAWVRRFDNCLPVEPGRFYIEVPVEFIEKVGLNVD